MEKILIVGSGMTGLALGRMLADFSPLILDKGKGVGGRMATRRTENAVFDHGAQFFLGRPELADLRDFWKSKWVSQRWFDSPSGTHFCAKAGMTALAKAIAENMRVDLNTKVSKLIANGAHWQVTAENGKTYTTETLILTAPLPQALELLKQNSISYAKDLETVRYAHALVGLFELDPEQVPAQSFAGYFEPREDGIQTVIDQMEKGVSTVPAWTVIMESLWSEEHFNADENATLETMMTLIQEKWNARAISSQLKKWRYSHPVNPLTDQPTSFAQVIQSPGLYLAGDAFGGGSIHGAVRSAFSLAGRIKSNAETK